MTRKPTDAEIFDAVHEDPGPYCHFCESITHETIDCWHATDEDKLDCGEDLA